MSDSLKILAWDLETSSLNADYGIILCAGFKVVGEGKVKILSIADYPGYLKDCTNDKQLCKDIAKILNEHEVWLTHYGKRFDVPFLNSRLLYHGLPPVNFANQHIDTWRVSRDRLKLRNNRLFTVQDFLQLEHSKDSVKGPIWVKAISGRKGALRYVVNHCKKDILVLEEAYIKLRPLMSNHPRQPVGACTVCGSNKVQKRGWHRTMTNIFQRYQCIDCGKWSRDGVPKGKPRSREAPKAI